ncbi:MAG: M14 family zinc carboxypeptidase, partial [Planctomycetota bacterium]|nr:M14 family zinc carboxypeptidase [Planctomycetota bacterium]
MSRGQFSAALSQSTHGLNRISVVALAALCILRFATAQDPEPAPDIQTPIVKPAQDPPPKPAEDPVPKPPDDAPHPEAEKPPAPDTQTPPKPEVETPPPPKIDPPPVTTNPIPVTTPVSTNPPATLTTATIDYAQRADEKAYNAEIARLVSAYPARVKQLSLGKSRGGRELTLLAITNQQTGALETKPAVLLVTGLDPAFESRPAGPEAALFAARALLESAEREPATAAWLEKSGVYVMAAPDPDQTFAPDQTLPRACRLDRNFPSGWKPWSSETCAQGPYPLSEPETHALSRFLVARTNVGGVMLLSRGRDLSAQPTPLEASECERILFGRIAAEEAAAGIDAKSAADALVRRALVFAQESGSLAAFCRSRLSAFVWPMNAFDGAVVETPLGRAPSDFTRLAPGLAKLASELPRI